MATFGLKTRNMIRRRRCLPLPDTRPRAETSEAPSTRRDESRHVVTGKATTDDTHHDR